MILEQINFLKELTFPSILLRTFLAMMLSGILGYEREKGTVRQASAPIWWYVSAPVWQ